MTHAENKIEWCLKKAEKEGRKHRGLKRIKPNKQEAKKHIEKAEHNIQVMKYLIDGEFYDWVIPVVFYTHYHSLLAVLQKFGYESRNQECTFAVIEELIEKKKIIIEKEEISKIFMNEDFKEIDMVNLRERFQYGTETMFEKEKIEEMQSESIRFLEKIKTIIES